MCFILSLSCSKFLVIHYIVFVTGESKSKLDLTYKTIHFLKFMQYVDVYLFVVWPVYGNEKHITTHFEWKKWSRLKHYKLYCRNVKCHYTVQMNLFNCWLTVCWLYSKLKSKAAIHQRDELCWKPNCLAPDNQNTPSSNSDLNRKRNMVGYTYTHAWI